MFIKHYLNYMHLLHNTSMISYFILYRYHSFPFFFLQRSTSYRLSWRRILGRTSNNNNNFIYNDILIWFVCFRLNPSKNMLIILPTWNVLVLVLVNISSTKTLMIKHKTSNKKNILFFHIKLIFLISHFM